MNKKDFIKNFLGINDNDFADLYINPSMMVDLLEAYEKEMMPVQFLTDNQAAYGGKEPITISSNFTEGL